MPRSYLLLLFLTVLGGEGRAQEDYLKYHKRITACEEAFLFKNDVRKAVEGYKAVFTDYKKPFTTDCFIALQLVCTTGDTANATYFFRTAFERGLSWTAVEMSGVINDFFDRRPAYRERIQQLYPIARQKWERHIDIKLRDIVTGMKLRDDTTKWTMAYVDQKSQEHYRRVQNYMDVIENNSAELIQLTRQNGFLGDNKLGFLESWPIRDSAEAKTEYRYCLYTYSDQLFYHDICLFLVLQPELAKSLKDGEISPARYAIIHDWAVQKILNKLPNYMRNHPQSRLCTAQRPDRIWYCMAPMSNCSEDEIPFIDSCRSTISMATVSHVSKKKEYEKTHKMKLFFGPFDAY